MDIEKKRFAPLKNMSPVQSVLRISCHAYWRRSRKRSCSKPGRVRNAASCICHPGFLFFQEFSGFLDELLTTLPRLFYADCRRSTEEAQK
jgi:hypothetical protein